MTRAAYSTVKLLFLLLLVEASSGRYWGSTFSCIESLHARYSSESIQDCFYYPMYVHPEGNLTIRWDIMNETRGGYTANVTIINYFKNHDIQGPWKLDWRWVNDEILLSTVGAKSSNDSFRLGMMNNIIIVDDLPLQTDDDDDDQRIVPVYDDLAKSSFSCQIDVGRANLNYHLPAIKVTLTTPKRTYRCNELMKVTQTPGYLNTWSTSCHLNIPSIVVVRKIEVEEL